MCTSFGRHHQKVGPICFLVKDQTQVNEDQTQYNGNHHCGNLLALKPAHRHRSLFSSSICHLSVASLPDCSAMWFAACLKRTTFLNQEELSCLVGHSTRLLTICLGAGDHSER